MDSERISILNVGTKILAKDVMDQYLRTLGDFRTHYAQNMSAALRVFGETNIQVLITEVDLPDGSAYRLVKELGGDKGLSDLYIILALESRSEPFLNLATEIEANAVMIKPFSAQELKTQIERYQAWKAMPKEPWVTLVEEAKMAVRDRRYRDAEIHLLDAIKVSPLNPGPHYKAGLYFLEKQDLGVAEKLLKKAIELKADYVPAMATLGRLYLQKRDLGKAEEMLSKAHAISPLNPDRLSDLVRMYLEQAVDICKTSLRVDPSEQAARLMLGKLKALQKDYVSCVQELEKVLPDLRDSARTEAQTFMALARKLGGIAKS